LARTTITPVNKWVSNGNKGMSRDEQEIANGDYVVHTRNKELTTAQVDNQTAADFFTFLQLVLNDPSMLLIIDSKKESDFLEKLTKINIGSGLAFEWGELNVETQNALTIGFEAGRVLVKKYGQEGLKDVNGWGFGGAMQPFETDWLFRSVLADFGWLGPDKIISHTAAFAFTDTNKEPLNGKNNYTITFDMDNLPPVSEFWSIPLYDAAGYFTDNEIDRFSINSFQLESGLLHVENKKLILYLQNEKPTDPNQFKNWLPTPTGGFRMTPRFYGPKYPLINGSYEMPKIVKSN